MANAPGQPRGDFPPQQYPPQYVYLPHPQPQPQQSVERITVPLLLFLSASVFIGWASWFGTQSINSIQSNIKDISVALTNYIDVADNRVRRIEDELNRRNGDLWTKADQQLFCARTESVDGNKGWKCGDYNGGFALFDQPPIWRGLQPNPPPALAHQPPMREQLRQRLKEATP